MNRSQGPSAESQTRQPARPRGRRSLSWVILPLSLALILLPAVQPLLSADFTCGYDNEFHLWRAVQLEHLLRQGILFSRWAPDMAHGYGYPLFNFTAPASAYGVALLHLAGVPWPWALNVTFALGWVLSAFTMFVFVGDLFDRRAGLVAAVLYAYVPFHAYDVFYRGGLSQSSAWLFPPLILWALRRADRRAGFTVAALGTAGLLLTHNAFALLFAPILLAYLLVVGRGRGRTVALWGGLALLVGAGLSAFFWLPALVDLSSVQSERASGAWVFEYTSNFLPWRQLFALPRAADPALINDWPERGLGLVPALIALAGLLGLRDRQRRLPVAFFALMLGLCLILTLPASRAVWDALPLLQHVQFPWRLVGPAALCAGVLSGAAAFRLRSLVPRPSFFAPAALAVLLAGSHLGWFYPRHCSPPGDISVPGMLAWERATDTIGTTASREFLPLWVERMPQDTVLEERIASGGPVARLDETSLPEGAAVLETDYGPLGATFALQTPAPFRARYLAFYFSGWRVWIDGEPVEVIPAGPEGLITFDLPAGRHEVVVRFGETPVRLIADGLSAVTLCFLIALALRGVTSRSGQRSGWSRPEARPKSGLPLLLIALLIPLLKAIVIDRFENPLRRSNLVDGRLVGVDVSAVLTFDGQFRLLGHDALPTEIPGDQALQIGLYWQDVVPGGPNYQIGLALKDDQGRTWSQPEVRPPRFHRVPPPTSLWPSEGYALTAFELRPLVGTPPGLYTVTLAVFEGSVAAPYTAHDAVGTALGPEIALGSVRVDRPRRLPAPEEVSPAYPADARFGSLRLVGYSVGTRAAPGDALPLTLFWLAEEAPGMDLAVQLRLLDPAGEVASVFDLPPVRDDFATSRWQAGDLWRGQHLLRLPARLESGPHRWVLQVCRVEGGGCVALGEGLDLGELQVQSPERLWTVPPLDVATDARLGDMVTLLGATLQPEARRLEPGAPLTVTLAWRAEAEMGVSYRVFLHLLGPDGVLVAQSDGEPAGWTRPTTGWLPGEIVLDERALALPDSSPPGVYRLQAGMYTLESGRLTTTGGSDAVTLTEIVVEEENE